MLYDDQAHLETWKQTGRFPSIHDDLFNLISTETVSYGGRWLDLCCSIGLMGQRLLSRSVASYSWGLDADEDALSRAWAAGIESTGLHFTLKRDTLTDFLNLVSGSKTDAVVARRCLSEIFADDPTWGPEFLAGLKAAGVRELFFQGRLPVSDASHPIPTVYHEAGVLVRGKAERLNRFGPQLLIVGQCARMDLC